MNKLKLLFAALIICVYSVLNAETGQGGVSPKILDTNDIDGIVDIDPSINAQKNDSIHDNKNKALSGVKQVLFDGQGLGDNWQEQLETKYRATFKDVAKFQNGELRVDMPKGKSWGQAGLSSKGQLLWLDQFGPGAEKRLTFRIDPKATTSFALALATKNNDKTFVVKWVRRTSKETALIEIFVDYGLSCNPDWPTHAKPAWQQEVSLTAPDEIVFTLTPGKITVSGKGFSVHKQAWPSLKAEYGFWVHAYSLPEKYDGPAKLALKRIILEDKVLKSVTPPPPLEGVKPLPVKEFFGPSRHEGWQMTKWSTYDKNKPHNICWLDDEGFHVPHGRDSNDGCDIHPVKPNIKLDDRLETAVYKLTAQFDPRQTGNFRIELASTERKKWSKSYFTREITLVRSTSDSSAMTLNCTKYGKRDVSAKWLRTSWNGRFTITFGKDWMRCALEGSPAVRVEQMPAKEFSTYIIAADWRYKGTKTRLLFKRLTGQWQTLHPMTAVERWNYLEEQDFDPEKYLKDLKGELSW